jgi:hypothetical protein
LPAGVYLAELKAREYGARQKLVVER